LSRPAVLLLSVLLLLPGCRTSARAPADAAGPRATPAADAAFGEADPPAAPELLATDIDGDGVAETVEAYFSAGRARGFLRVRDGEAEWTSPAYRMWKVLAARLDGDAREELILGVWSDTRRHAEPEPHRAVWVLGWDGGALRELWRGSALARPLLDVSAADIDGDGLAELLALDVLDGVCRVAAYRWDGFGFAGRAGPVVVPCSGLRFCADGPPGCIEADGRRLNPSVSNGELRLGPLASLPPVSRDSGPPAARIAPPCCSRS
jgi:hypothetical protein